jgi:hypothetical protein
MSAHEKLLRVTLSDSTPQLSLLPPSSSAAEIEAVPSARVTLAGRVRTTGGSTSLLTMAARGLSALWRFRAVTV